MAFRRKTMILTFAAMLAMGFSADAFARAGSGGSFGSRGGRTFSAPRSTTTAPRGAAPMERSMTSPSQGISRPGAANPGGGFFSGGFGRGLLGGLVGAGLFGMLFGHGFLGGMGGFASILGLILQVVLVIFVARLAFAWWQRRNQPAYAAPGASSGQGPAKAAFTGLGGGLGGMFGGGGSAAPAGQPITIAKEDYDDFEQLLADVQAAYSAEDLNALRAKVTPEMVSYFSEQLAENAGQGLINRVTDVKLMQGDLAEAWHEDNADYATVAMRFALTDSMVERSGGRVVEGGTPGEVTELWTFRRGRSGPWMLSAIQQA